jgi:DNA-binding response OmpR family regulator
VDEFVKLILKSRQSELTNYANLFSSHQSLSISALPGTGKSLIFTNILPYYLSQNFPDKFNTCLTSCLDSNFAEIIYDLEFDQQHIHLLILDDLTPSTIDSTFLPLWDYLWAKRTALQRRLVFLFLTNQPLEPSLFGRLGFCYLENQKSLHPFNLDETAHFIHSVTSNKFKTDQIQQIYSASSGNLRLIKSMVKEIDNGSLFDNLLKNPSPRISFFFDQIQSETSLKSEELKIQFPQFAAYFSPKPVSNLDFSLTVLEKRLFTLFLKNRGQLLTRQVIVESVWSESKQFDLYDHSIDQLVYRLKNKLKGKFRIQSLKGRGFVLD